MVSIVGCVEYLFQLEKLDGAGCYGECIYSREVESFRTRYEASLLEERQSSTPPMVVWHICFLSSLIVLYRVLSGSYVSIEPWMMLISRPSVKRYIT
jgi:hypothetical protein